MSYKDELKKQIEELENSIDVDSLVLSRLRQELHNLQVKEKTESTFGQQQLLQG